MSLHALEPDGGEHGVVGAGQKVSMQFENIDQQNESYIVGMWSFLVTEIMFFGALFVTYSLYRVMYFDMYLEAHQFLNVTLGTINTTVLLSSSLFMVLGVYAAQHGKRIKAILWLLIVIACAAGFMVVKYFEYTSKLHEGLFPDRNFNYARALKISHDEGHGGHGGERASRAWTALEEAVKEGGKLTEEGFEPAMVNPTGMAMDTRTAKIEPNTVSVLVPSPAAQRYYVQANHARLFFSIYFSMTGLHGIHVLIGILCMGLLAFFYYVKHPCVEDYLPLEMVGLYWHFVDIVWIFLFPLMYLIS